MRKMIKDVKPWAYYNDSNPYVCEWARNLIRAGLVMDGEVDERPIQEVRPDDLKGFIQHHFFCGILGWPLALDLAGWRGPVWTGSCPCQPLSSAGQHKGHADRRHLWPAFYDLIAECRPATVFGEQIASKDGREWLAGVRADLESMGYAVGCADLPAAGVGAPHIRQRFFWVSYATRGQERSEKPGDGEGQTAIRWASGSSPSGRFIGDNGRTYRIPKPCIPFVVDGFPGCVEQVSAYGNAIVPQVAAEFVKAYMDDAVA